MLEGGEPGSLVGIGTCDVATRRHPTTDQLATAKRHRSALAGHASARGERAAQSACAVLGAAHPLSRATGAVARVTRQWLACAATLAGSIIAQLEGHPWATTLTARSTLVLAGLTTALLMLRQQAVIGLLQTRNPPARGMALIDRLITDDQSVFYGHEPLPLREELRHIRKAFEQ